MGPYVTELVMWEPLKNFEQNVKWSDEYFRKCGEWRALITTRVKETNQETTAKVHIRNDMNSDSGSDNRRGQKDKKH